MVLSSVYLNYVVSVPIFELTWRSNKNFCGTTSSAFRRNSWIPFEYGKKDEIYKNVSRIVKNCTLWARSKCRRPFIPMSPKKSQAWLRVFIHGHAMKDKLYIFCTYQNIYHRDMHLNYGMVYLLISIILVLVTRIPKFKTFILKQ